MKEATIIYPHQLFRTHPAIKKGRPIYLLEEPLILTHNGTHRIKLLFHLETIDAYESWLRKQKHTVTRLSITEYQTTAAFFNKLRSDGITTIHTVDTTDTYLEREIKNSGLVRVWYESPLFILTRENAIERYQTSKKFMASFYRQLRIDTGILMEEDRKPTGGSWSFDSENRKRVPRSVTPPRDITISPISAADKTRLDAIQAEQYGAYGRWLPTTHTEADLFLQSFLEERFENFGTYEDAITTESARLWHSTLSPLLNIGLLTPQQVLDEVIAYAKVHTVPINSLEGFVRQILGWREFIRASYECDGSKMRTQNFFKHTRKLPVAFWDGTTSLLPLDHTIATLLKSGYSHHIERLMVLGNSMLLLQIHPDEVYRWFMSMYVDAYDWVMVPNVYGMSQFADGGSFATKPYISGANYLKKMSNYPAGDWEETWTALYWHFIHSHKEVFINNHRMSMMPRLLEKMPTEKRARYFKTAQNFLDTLQW